jgi:hypothetical protein
MCATQILCMWNKLICMLKTFGAIEHMGFSFDMCVTNNFALLQNLFYIRVISLFVVHSTSGTCMKQFCTIIALIIFICANVSNLMQMHIWPEQNCWSHTYQMKSPCAQLHQMFLTCILICFTCTIFVFWYIWSIWDSGIMVSMTSVADDYQFTVLRSESEDWLFQGQETFPKETRCLNYGLYFCDLVLNSSTKQALSHNNKDTVKPV